MTFLIDPEHFLDLRLGLQHEILGAAAAQDHHTAPAATAFGVEHNRRGLVDVEIWIENELVSVERDGRDVHPDRAVAW